MLGENKNWRLLITMMLSVILLLSFILYFLNAEFIREKEAMKLEMRDDVFVQIIRDLDPHEGNAFKLRTDSSRIWDADTTNKPIRYIIESLSDTFLFPEFKSFELRIDSVKASRGEKFPSRLKHNVHDDLDTFITVTTDIKGGFFSDTNDLGVVTTIKKDFVSDIARSSNSLYMSQGNSKINPWDVIKRLYAPILFSLFLLFSVIFSFYLVLKTLRKEQLLASLRSDFISNISHELKTPVSTISVALEAISNFDAAENKDLRKEYIDISKNEIDRLGMLVDKTLQISLHEQGRFNLDIQDVNIDGEIEKILKTLNVQLENENVELNYSKEGNNFNVKADQTHLVNVIYNLIENGIKYSNKPAQMDLHLVEKLDTIQLEIADKGVGIPAIYQDKVFDKFFRVPKGNTHNVKGYGLGLSYVKDTIEKMKGKISLVSKEGEGSQFTIALPKVI